MALPKTIEDADIAAVKAYRWAARGGVTPSPDSPLAKAAYAAISRQETLRPGTAFVSKALGEVPIDQRMQDAAVAWGRRQAAIEPPKLPVPSEDAVGILRRSLAGQGTVDLSGGASTIGTDFESKFAVAERARALMNDPLFPAAMTKARANAVKKGRPMRAEDLDQAMTAARAERGPQPLQPPAPVVALFAPSENAAKSTTSSFSVIPDRFGGR